MSKIDPQNVDKSVDSIFKMIDYGHQSIADMVPISIFLDGVSILLAYKIWSLCPTAGGQESSTRYIKLAEDEVVDPNILGIPEKAISEWRKYISESFQSYAKALDIWESVADKDPSIMGIPKAILLDESDLGKKKLARLKRNFGFDRARYFLPVAAKTNVMLLMSARGWISLCQQLLSSGWREAAILGGLIRKELELVTPRLLKHASYKEDFHRGSEIEFEKEISIVRKRRECGDLYKEGNGARSGAFLDCLVAPILGGESDLIKGDLAHHPTRYSWVGTGLQRMAVRFGWEAISMAEIRDLNRHRTGTKYCPLVARGFYFAQDQIAKGGHVERALESTLEALAKTSRDFNRRSNELLENGEKSHAYWTNLGAQYYFEHTTTADKFIYEAELRTGIGAHYRYAFHMKEVLQLWYEKFPETKGLIIEGGAEPE